MGALIVRCRNLTKLYLVLFLLAVVTLTASSFDHRHLATRVEIGGRRKILESEVKPKKTKKIGAWSDQEEVFPENDVADDVSAVKPKKVKIKTTTLLDGEDGEVKAKREKSVSLSEEEGEGGVEVKPKKMKNKEGSEGKLKKIMNTEESEADMMNPKKQMINAEESDSEMPNPKKKMKNKVESDSEMTNPKKKMKNVESDSEMTNPKKKKNTEGSDSDVPKLKKTMKDTEESDAETEPKPKNAKVLNLSEADQSKPMNKTKLIKMLSSSKNQTKSMVQKKQTSTSVTADLPKQNAGKSKEQMESKASNSSKKDKKPAKSQKKPSWLEEEDDIDIVAQMKEFPSKFQQSLIPDMEKISSVSKKYLTRANKDLIKGIKPIVGNKYASTIASFVSFAFIVIPLLLLPLIFSHIKAYFSLQKILISIQAYLAIYFSILCLSSLITGLEPLKFFFTTSTSTYLCVIVLQTLAYLLYLLMLLMYLVLVFSTESTLVSKIMGLGQTLVGFAVGLHFYMAVFHRVVLRQLPMTNWKVHGAYATCFIVVCGFAASEKSKKTYLEDGGEEGKRN